MDALIGREDAELFEGHREETRWIGKPWRRVSLTRFRTFYRGEQIDVTRDLSFHFGLRRIGLGATVTFVKASCLAYTCPRCLSRELRTKAVERDEDDRDRSGAESDRFEAEASRG